MLNNPYLIIRSLFQFNQHLDSRAEISSNLRDQKDISKLTDLYFKLFFSDSIDSKVDTVVESEPVPTPVELPSIQEVTPTPAEVITNAPPPTGNQTPGVTQPGGQGHYVQTQQVMITTTGDLGPSSATNSVNSIHGRSFGGTGNGMVDPTGNRVQSGDGTSGGTPVHTNNVMESPNSISSVDMNNQQQVNFSHFFFF